MSRPTSWILVFNGPNTIELWLGKVGTDRNARTAGEGSPISREEVLNFTTQHRKVDVVYSERTVLDPTASTGAHLVIRPEIQDSIVLASRTDRNQQKLDSPNLLFSAGSNNLGIVLKTPAGYSPKGSDQLASPTTSLPSLASADISTDERPRIGEYRIQQTLKGDTYLDRIVHFSPNSELLATARISHERIVKLWILHSGKSWTLHGHDGPILDITFSPDSKLLASASQDTDVILWSTSSGKMVKMLGGHKRSVVATAFSLDGDILASASRDQTVKLWDTQSGNSFRTLKGQFGEMTAVAFSPDGKLLAAASSDRTVRLWNIQAATKSNRRLPKSWTLGTREVEVTLEREVHGTEPDVVALVFSYDSQLLISKSLPYITELRNISSGFVNHRSSTNNLWSKSMRFTSGGKLLASQYNMVKMWSTSLKAAQQAIGTRQATGMAFSSDYKLLATAWMDGSVTLWALDDLSMLSTVN